MTLNAPQGIEEGGPERPADGEAKTDPRILQACDTVGRAIELWGFKRVHGMIWTWLYLRPEASSAHDIKEGLGISTGLTSMTLADLAKWGVIHRRTPAGERRELFEAERNIWQPIFRVLREREYHAMGEALDSLRAIASALATQGTASERHAATRLQDLIQLGELAHKTFGRFLDLGIIDLRDLRQLSLGQGLGRTIATIRRLLKSEDRHAEDEGG
jgi:DNA-binding transcriptional regulator GbsR (MarR family)